MTKAHSLKTFLDSLRLAASVFAILPVMAAEVHDSVILPEKYRLDPGAEFALVLVGDLARPTREICALADSYADAVFVCAKDSERGKLLDSVMENYRVYRFPRGRIERPSLELAKPEAVESLRNYFRWGRYQAKTPELTRYGARLYRRCRGGEGGLPRIELPCPWRLIDGDDGATGCDSRLYYFTIEAEGRNLEPPEVKVVWPGVELSGFDGVTNVVRLNDGVKFVPIGKHGGVGYYTQFQDGSIDLVFHHHVEGAQHGPYGGRPLPWPKIRASDNWRAACRAMFKLAGLGTIEETAGASIKLYGFDSNFPNRHVDHPEHFHVMLEWDGWRKNNVGHYTLDDRGFILGNNFLVCGEIDGGLPAGYHPQHPGETTEYVGPGSKVLMCLAMLEGGRGLVLERPGVPGQFRVSSENPAESVTLSRRVSDFSEWQALGSYSVNDDTEAGVMEIVCRSADGATLLRDYVDYDRDTGTFRSVRTCGPSKPFPVAR